MKIPSLKKCDKQHKLEYYHRAGIEWCLWCPKCRKTGFYGQNFYRWEKLSKIDDFFEEYFTVFAWKNKITRLKWELAKRLVGSNATCHAVVVNERTSCPICNANIYIKSK